MFFFVFLFSFRFWAFSCCNLQEDINDLQSRANKRGKYNKFIIIVERCQFFIGLTILTSGQILNSEPFKKICENAGILYLVIQISYSDVASLTNALMKISFVH